MPPSSRAVRVRIAPSPTGPFHAGGARTALYNWLFARHHGGAFLVRIEDTDRTRYSAAAEADMLESLRWLGLDWDEGPEVGGPYGPYVQSERVEIHQHYAQVLLDGGQAYRCFCPPERLEALRRGSKERQAHVGYDRHCRDLPPEQVEANLQAGLPFVVRLKMPLDGTTVVHDRIRGTMTFENGLLEDTILLKSDGFPTYHLANVVDDHLMEISHVMRGAEWVPSLPIHVLLYNAFGWPMPEFAHLPIILSPTGKGKMSKRKIVSADGKEYPVMISEFRQAGYLPEAMINILARTGWAYDDQTELFTREELVEKFSVERVTSAPGAFSYDKLLWMNGHYMRELPPADLADRCAPFLQEAGLVSTPISAHERELLEQVVVLLQERLHLLRDVVDQAAYFFTAVDYPDPTLLLGKKMDGPTTRLALQEARRRLAALPEWEAAALEPPLRDLAEEQGWKAGQLFMPIRVAVTGRTVSPGLFETLHVLGREKSLARMDRAIEVLEGLG